MFINPLNVTVIINCIIGNKRRSLNDTCVEPTLGDILTKFVEVSEECETKRQKVELEVKEKHREQERRHEERMMTMMMGFMTRMMAGTQQSIHMSPYQDMPVGHSPSSSRQNLTTPIYPGTPSYSTPPGPYHFDAGPHSPSYFDSN